MPRRLLLFNPENDLALAHGTAFFTPPVSAVTMAREMAELPLIWAQSEDVVFNLYSNEPFPEHIDEICPWGWSEMLVRQLRQRGCDESLLPTKEMLDAYRRQSSRRVAVEALACICRDILPNETLVGESAWCESEEEVRRQHDYYKEVLLKAPWSGSGRGLHYVRQGDMDEKSLAWVRRTLKKQGGVVVEKFLHHKVLDFAMEFEADRGDITYAGLSVFETRAGGVYAGNIVASELYKECILTQYIPRELLCKVREAVLQILREGMVASWYRGPIGIDMLICEQSDGSFALNPFVEMNHRTTMGWVALQLARQQTDDMVRYFSVDCQQGRYYLTQCCKF